MYQRFTTLLLRLLKVPHEPQPPPGNPDSLQVFRAGRNLFTLKLFGWGFGQLVALAGIIFWLVMFIEIEGTVRSRRQAHQSPVSPLTTKNFEEYIEKISAEEKPDETRAVQPAAPADKTAKPAETGNKNRRTHVRINGWAGFKKMLVELAMFLPLWSFPLLWALKILGFLAYLAQLPVTYLIARMDYELRWYMVTDRSLRIRYGVWKVAESTMSFANIQQVIVSQGPIQRLLGLADVKVQSAGGGSGDAHKKDDDDLHMGLFHSVTNAPEIRDLIQERLRRFRESGLGDPEEAGRRVPLASHGLGEGWSPPERGTESAPYPLPASPDLLAAARELAAEARALRASLG